MVIKEQLAAFREKIYFQDGWQTYNCNTVKLNSYNTNF